MRINFKVIFAFLLFSCSTSVIFPESTNAEWVKKGDGTLEWVGEIPGTHKKCVEEKLLTKQCFYKVWSEYGFKGKALEQMLNDEKNPRVVTYAVCAEYLWDKPYENFVECRRLLLNKEKNSISNKKFRQLLEELAN